MSANPPKRDAWPDYPHIQFVLITQPGKQRPIRGLVLDWRGSSRKQAQVVYVQEATPTSTKATRVEWIWQEFLVPVDVDPNYRAGKFV